MGKNNSTLSGSSTSGGKINQASGSSKDATAPPRTNARMVQNVLLVWLDNNIDENNSEDSRNSITQLRRVVNSVDTFTDGDQCIAFLSEKKDEKACMIISGSLGQHIVPQVHGMSQVDSIFIFCSNKSWHEKWSKDWPKINGVFTEITPICEALKTAARQCEQNAISISFMPASAGGASNKSLDQLDSSFMYTQILKEILLTINFEQLHFNEYIDFCRTEITDHGELANVQEFKQQYRDKTPIWWYTYECFLYPMLNRALRVMDVDIIIKMGFFVRDLHQHIDRLHMKQFGTGHPGQSFIVYRGQGLSKVDFDEMMKTKGGLIAFNSFLSTSKDRNISIDFARPALPNADMVGILFVMTIEPSISSTPFASITDVSYYKDREDEVLFSMNTVFRIRDIKQMDENKRLWQVDLLLTSDNDPDLRALTDRMREETFPKEPGWHRLGKLLFKLGQPDKAQQVYQVLLGQTSSDSEKGTIYHCLGLAKGQKGEYNEAVTFYEKALEIRQKTLPPNHPNLATSYNNIGLVYDKMGDYSKALLYYEKALEIRQKTLPPNHPNLATSYNNIGLVYDKMGDYSKALLYYEKALEISQKTLPPNHPNLATSYNNIGLVYDKMGDYSKALSYYEKALEICQKTFPPNHPSLATSHNNIGSVYSNMGDYSKALSSHEKALKIRQKTLPPNHPDLATSYNNIGSVYYKMGDYSKALSSHEKALKIRQKTLPPNHPDLATSYNNIGMVYSKMGDYSKALSYYEKALEISQKALPPNHPNLATSYNNIGSVYSKMGDYSKAVQFVERAVNIGQRSLPANHPDLETYKQWLEHIKKKL